MVWYTQVSPTATGNGIEAGATREFEVVLEVSECVPPPRGSLEATEAAPVERLLAVPTPMLTSG